MSELYIDTSEVEQSAHRLSAKVEHSTSELKTAEHISAEPFLGPSRADTAEELRQQWTFRLQTDEQQIASLAGHAGLMKKSVEEFADASEQHAADLQTKVVF